jgi:5'/3'-nucleotidase SurE
MVIDKDDKLILLTNDDGLYAAGLKTLLEVMEEIGKVVMVSTLESQSGMSQALTVKTPLRIKLLEENEKRRVYACSGTPTDSVKLAVNQLLERTPDFVVSGVNQVQWLLPSKDVCTESARSAFHSTAFHQQQIFPSARNI